MKRSVIFVTASLCFLALMGCAKRDPNSPSGMRHTAFENISKASKTIDAILKADNPDLAAAAGPIATLKSEVAGLPSLFPPGSGPESDQPTEALATIWTNPTEFAAEMQGLSGAVLALDEALVTGDQTIARKAFADLGKACKSCHSKFRED